MYKHFFRTCKYILLATALVISKATFSEEASGTPQPNEFGWYVEPVRTMQADGIEWSHTMYDRPSRRTIE